MKKIHPTAIIEGDVDLGENVYVSPYAVIKGDEGKVVVGEGSNVQDHCLVHGGGGVTVGKGVTVGHRAVLHGCTVHDNVLIGIGAIVLDGAEVGEWSVIGAGAVVPPGMKIEPGSVAMGIPAKVVKKTSEKHKELIARSCHCYVEKVSKEE